MKTPPSYPADLRTKMVKAFDEDEIKTLCFDLNIDFDDIKGDNKSGKVRELILFVSRRNRLSELIALCKTQRPNESWLDISDYEFYDPSLSAREHTKPLTPEDHDKPSKATLFIQELGNKMILDKGYLRVTGSKFKDFSWFGIQETGITIDFTAFILADHLNIEHYVKVFHQFFDLTVKLPIDFGLKPRGRNPNGLLCFVFEKEPPSNYPQFIKKQSRISHKAGKGGVSVSWCIDLEALKIYTHHICVSVCPPVIIPVQLLPPGLTFIDEFLRKFK